MANVNVIISSFGTSTTHSKTTSSWRAKLGSTADTEHTSLLAILSTNGDDEHNAYVSVHSKNSLNTYRRHHRVDLFQGKGDDARQKAFLATGRILFHQ